MGLDMYAFAVKPEYTSLDGKDTPCITVENPETNAEEIVYWRKFNALHNFMENIYHELDGKQEFNCNKLPLTEEILNRLKEVCDAKELTPIEGFFFGSQKPVTDEEYQNVLFFINDAKKYLAEGYIVYYTSWW